MKCIVNGRIITPYKTFEDKVLVFDDKIREISDRVPENAEKIDAGGGYVSPGLIDIHIHGYLGEDASDGKPEGIRKIAGGIIENGVTGFLPTTMTVSKDEINRAFEAVRSLREESKTWRGAQILGVNSEGPFINPEKRGAQAEEHILPPDADFIINNSDIVKISTIAPEMDDGYKNIKKITENTDVTVSVGHSCATFEQTLQAVANGASHITHLFNAQTPLHHRRPGIVGAALSSNAVSCELIADTFHVHPGLFDLIARVKGEKLVLISDCTRAGGMPDGEYSLGGQPIFLKGIECRLADGTIAGSVLKLNCAVKNLRDNTRLPIHSIVACASLHPARVIGVAKTKGSLEVGKDADIVITDLDFNVKKTIISGVTQYEA